MRTLPCLLTKLSPPKREEVLKRTVLLHQCSSYSAILLIAPTGYGKTSLLYQITHRREIPLIWYKVDTHDNDPSVFFHYLITGIRKYHPSFGEKIIWLAEEGTIHNHQRFVTTTLINELVTHFPEGLFIALDDYHFIENPLIHSFIQHLIEHIPSGLSIGIASRKALPFSSHKLFLRGDLLTLHKEDLSFSLEEMETLLKR